jgi:hypothetical protein
MKKHVFVINKRESTEWEGESDGHTSAMKAIFIQNKE